MQHFNNLNIVNVTTTEYEEGFPQTYNITLEHPTNPNILYIHVEVTEEYLIEHNIPIPTPSPFI